MEKIILKKSDFKHVANSKFQSIINDEKLSDKQKRNRLIKAEAERVGLLNAPDVAEIEINVDWHRSQTWGHNPKAVARVWYVDNTFEEIKETASGCGYDKLAAVVCRIISKAFAAHMLRHWRKIENYKKNDCNSFSRPRCYARRFYKDSVPYVESCTSDLSGFAKSLGFKYTQHSGTTWDFFSLSK